MESNDFPEFVPNVHFELIPIKNLVSNQEYQRGLSLSHVQKAADNFDLYQINPVKVSRRDGTNYVINGQHTIEIVATVSGSRETPVWCMIYDDLIYTEEADIFANQQKYVKNLLPYEIFVADIEAGNEKQLLIKTLVESYRLQIVPVKGNCGICAIGTLINIHDKYGYHVLDRVLRLVVGTWEGVADSLSANMLAGIARLVHAYGDTLKDEMFKNRLGFHSARDITRQARERRNGSLGFAEVMLDIYNKKCRNPLRRRQLYTGSKKAMEMEDDELFDTNGSVCEEPENLAMDFG